MGGTGAAFRGDFTGDGESRLRERVKEKLKEFTADDDEDTLVEYVVVLLRNGIHKDEAMRELHVFLGNDSYLFVTWLWNHLSLNMHLYAESNPSPPNEADVDCGREKTRFSRIQRNREWKGSVRGTEPFPDQGIEKEKKHRRPSILKRLSSPESQLPHKRVRREEQPAKRDTAVASIGAPRRILQFAVRDAVRTVQQSNSKSEGASRLLHSVVSASTADISSNEKPQRPKSIARVSSALSAAIKAAAEAAEDVSKTRCSKNVFGRLGFGKVKIESSNHSLDYREADMDEEDVGEVDQMPEPDKAVHYRREEYQDDLIESVPASNRNTRTVVGSASDNDRFDEDDFLNCCIVNSSQITSPEKEKDSLMLQCSVAQDVDNIQNVPVSNRNTRTDADSASDIDGSYEGADILSYRNFNSSRAVLSTEKEKDSLMVQYGVAQDADNNARKTRPVIHDGPANEAEKSSSKIVNISVNVNTWKPHHDHQSNDVIQSGNRKVIGKCEEATANSNVDPKERNDFMERNNPVSEKKKEEACANVQKDPQKIVTSTAGSYMTARPLEDLDSRTVYVYNVHFAATKDALSCHFNKFGEVLKVVNMTDAATGQPTGSAFVEFLRKESAELALSLNGTPFMSRNLQVVQRSSAPHEVAAMIDWSRGLRPSPYSSRLCRAPYARGLRPAAFRASLPLKSRARSLQWKRNSSAAETSVAPQDTPLSSQSSSVASGGSDLTYVGTQNKESGSPA